ncbi:hypothetical protein [Mobilicoccus caccae]|uniref:Transcriptional regulator, AbiEi antitoxin, Type IV TA system n=1 Tax=Mobilicoccus caccae TaxID=1859295 RepID=A0ABQ6J0J1_9MICO|nr:hypothetical protein [Mobilicoccus caccae]GMA42411.1 hypothetical protein GCM10025883_44560 [Mobilicoccus caccae]GMA42487.1 hypothetical protein GCM10025883_45320 [Mobilicoccus caccae]
MKVEEVIGVRLTSRDVEWLAWMSRWRAVTAYQVVAWFDPDSATLVKQVERSCRRFRELGLVESAKLLGDRPMTHSVTREGLRVVEIEHAGRRPVVGTLHHDLAVVDCATWLHHRRSIGSFMTEVEIRAIDPPRAEFPEFALRAAPGAGRAILYPDLVTVHEQGLLAHEVELARKDRTRAVALMETYALSSRYLRVAYYGAPGVRKGLEEAAEKANKVVAGSGPKVFVRGWEWEERP